MVAGGRFADSQLCQIPATVAWLNRRSHLITESPIWQSVESSESANPIIGTHPNAMPARIRGFGDSKDWGFDDEGSGIPRFSSA
jgi:hypothetical protein